MTTIGRTAYYVPVAERQLQKVLTELNVEEFLRNRLRRAETIIVTLRKELAGKNGD
jgi:hypothetical protein